MTLPPALLTEFQTNLAALVAADGDMTNLAVTTQQVRSRERKVLALKQMVESRLATLASSPTFALFREVIVLQHLVVHGDLP